MVLRNMLPVVLVAAVFCLQGCDDNPCGSHQHEYYGRCVCDYNYMLVGDKCIPVPEKKGWCPGGLVCTQLENDYLACTNTDGTLPGDPTVECPDYPAAVGNTSFVDLNGESVCILHCGVCTSGECVYVGSGFKYHCVEMIGDDLYIPPDTSSCTTNFDCRANRSCRALTPDGRNKYCLEHCSIPQIEDGDTNAY